MTGVWIVAAWLACCAALPRPVTAAEGDVLTIDGAQTAGIAGFRLMWDAPTVLDAAGVTQVNDSVVKDRSSTAVWTASKRRGITKTPDDKPTPPGPLAFDALQRSLLVRFPGAADAIAARLKDGGVKVAKVELVLPYKDTELWPPGDLNFAPPDGYFYRANWGVDELYRKLPPQWHAVVWALRRPWNADEATGPTFNAFINGAGYWAKYGAQDEQLDRYPTRFGPTEVSDKKPDGRVDVTPVLSDAAYGKSLEERIRAIGDQGFLVRKWETYDHRYFTGVYEWATGTGGRAILINAPRLVVTFSPDASAKPIGAIPPAADVAKLAAQLKADGKGGKPTAVMPTDEQLAAWTAEFTRKPEWMEQWQFDRVNELIKAESAGNADPLWYQLVPEFIRNRDRQSDPDTGQRKNPPALTHRDVYRRWVDTIIGRQPRGWFGFEAAREMNQWHLYRHMLPEPAKQAIIDNWTAWLLPDRPTTDLVHPMKDQLTKGSNTGAKIDGDSYYAATGDWRGNKSMYRSGFNYVISTMNFNHTAATGALLGGDIIKSDVAIADGRHGIEYFPLRLWSWADGSTQESIDHYYFAITLVGQKSIADYGPTQFDRMIGRTILAKSIDELAACYHPGLRRFIAGCSRTSIEHVLATQDGLYHIAHLFTKSGALRDLGEKKLAGNMPVLGHDAPPHEIAQQSLPGPWAPEWYAEIFDAKQFPWEMTAAYTQWGDHREFPMYRRSYLGKNYGLGSTDMPYGRVTFLGQWRRTDKQVDSYKQLGTMLANFGVNTTRFANEGGGWIAPLGATGTFQHKNKAILFQTPYDNGFTRGKVKKEGMKSVQGSVALYNYEDTPSWEIYAGNERVTSLPFKARQGVAITIKDGPSYVAVIPLPSSNLGRSDEVVLREGDAQEFSKVEVKPAVVIDSFILQSAEALTEDKVDWKKLKAAHAGFVIELGDAAEHGTFEKFREHIAKSRVEVKPGGENASEIAVAYTSGADTLAGTFLTTFNGEGKTPELFKNREVNGKWPYLEPGVFKQTPLGVQSVAGRIEVGGATLVTDPKRMAYLQCEPTTGHIVAFNPLPDANAFALTLPGGVAINADGKVAMTSVTYNTKTRRIDVDYARKPATASGRVIYNAKEHAVEVDKDASKSQGEKSDGVTATRFLVTGLDAAPQVTFNGKALTGLKSETVDGKKAWIIPLE